MLLAAITLLVAFVPAHADDPKHEAHIVLLHTNDLHGAVYPAEIRAKDGQVTGRRGGMTAVLAYVRKARVEARRNGDAFFLVDAGDFFQGTPEGDLPAGRLMVHLMNLAGYDLQEPGNHDFDQGPDNLVWLSRRARFPMICANVFRDDEKRSRPEWVRPWEIRTVQGVKIAFVGLITSDMPIVTTARARRGYLFQDEEAALLDTLPQLDVEEAPDLKILVTHCGVERDKQVAADIPGLTLIVGGHSHTALEQPWIDPKTGTMVVQTGSSARCVGRVDLTVDLDRKKVTALQSRLVPLNVDEVGEDPDALALVAGFATDIDREMNVAVGSAAAEMTRQKGAVSSPLGNLLCDIMREAAGAQIAFHNRTGIRADLPPGPLRLRDMYKVSPFSNTLVTLELTGADVLALLEHAVSEETRYFLETAGLEARFDPTAAVGGRVKSASLRDGDRTMPIDPQAKYKVVTNSFLAKGGDGHGPFANGTDVKDTGINLLDAQVDYFRAHSPVAAPEEERIRAQ